MTNRKNRDGSSIREDRPCGCPEKYFAYIVTVCLEPFNPSGLYKNTGDNAVFDDPQFGSYYIDINVVETEIAKIVDELCKEKESGNLYTHKFDEWR